MHDFYLDGVSCRQYGISVSGEDTFNGPERDVESLVIPGRNGDLILDNKRFKNTPVPYPAIVLGNFRRNAAAARAWLLSVPGYRRLEDNYHPDEFRLAQYKEGLEFKPWANNQTGEVTITFNCKPQRFLKSGEEAVRFTAPGILCNPTQFMAQPRISVSGSDAGELVINGNAVQLSDLRMGIILDCDIQRALDGAGNPKDRTMTGTFESLYLKPGENTISWSGGINAVSIVPRWWTV